MYTNKDLINEMNLELEQELVANEKFAEENFTEKAIEKNKLMNSTTRWLIGKILGNFKVQFRILNKKNEVIFEWTIPQN